MRNKKGAIVLWLLLIITSLLISGCREDQLGILERQEDFSGYNTWSISDGSYHQFNHKTDKEAYEIKIEKENWMAWSHMPVFDLSSNYAIETEVELISGRGYYGIIFEYVDDNNFYVFAVDSWSGHYKLTRNYNGNWHNIIDWTNGSYYINQLNNKLRLVHNNSQVKLYSNDELLAEEEIVNYPEGVKVGLVASAFSNSSSIPFTAHFDRVRLNGVSHSAYQEYQKSKQNQ